jgi:hypothetical protein
MFYLVVDYSNNVRGIYSTKEKAAAEFCDFILSWHWFNDIMNDEEDTFYKMYLAKKYIDAYEYAKDKNLNRSSSQPVYEIKELSKQIDESNFIEEEEGK